jgi:iron complex outermembrane receptor protein
MKDNFQGVQGEVNYSAFQHNQHNSLADVIAGRAATNPAQFKVPGDVSHDGDSTNVNLLMGGNFADNRGNASLFFYYQKDKAVLERDRDYSACATGSTNTALTCAGSSTSFPGRFLNANTGSSFTIANAAGGVRPFNSTLDQFNFAPYNYYQRPDERYGFNAFAHYDVNASARVYSEFSFHDDHTLAQIAPSGAFFGFEQIFTADNPLLSTAFRNAFGITATTPGDIIIGRRNLEGGGRIDDRRHTSFRTVIGVKGDILKNWDYDLYMQTAKVIYQETYLNDFSKVRLTRALDVVTNPATGLPICRSTLNGTDPNCVPYDIFHLGGVTDGALAYLQTPGLQKGSTEQMVQGATLSSDLGSYGLKMPGAKNGIGVAFGVERRTEKLGLETDTEFSTFDLAGQGGPTIGLNGKYTVKEYFGEARVPILEGAPMADSLSVNASYRFSDYSTNKTTDSYGLGIEWAPVRAVKVRGSYQQAVRAANIIELFQAQGLNLFSLSSDPCGANPTATLAQCQRSGITAAQYGSALITNPAGQYSYIQGGNPNLNPETAKTYTLGLVLQPMRNLSGTIDWFNIKVDQEIGNVSPALALQQCLASGQFCDLIHRDSFGTLWLSSGAGFVTATNQNISKVKTSGVDVAVNYNQNLPAYGGLAFSFNGTWLKEFVTEPIPGLGDYDCTGLYGTVCGTPLPKWRHKARVTWSTPWKMDLSLTWRHFDSVKLDQTSSNPLLNGSFNEINRELAARDYIDLSGSWAITKQLTLRAGVNNVFDKDPPIVDSAIAGPAFGNGNTYPQVYDALGRKLFASITMNF